MAEMFIYSKRIESDPSVQLYASCNFCISFYTNACDFPLQFLENSKVFAMCNMFIFDSRYVVCGSHAGGIIQLRL